MSLAENHFLFRTMDGPPVPDTTLHRAADPKIEIGMATAHLLKDGHRPQARRRSQHWHDLCLEDRLQRIRPPSAARYFTL
jgi:hypothetical protein